MTEYKLGDLIQIKNGKKYSHLNEGVIPVYGSGGIMCYVDDYFFDGKALLLPRKGTLNNIMYSEGKIWTVDTMYYATVNNRANPFYLYSYLKLLDLSKLDSGSALPSMTQGSYNNIKIFLPSISVQNEVASFLFELDQKIELNNQINTELEGMAKLVYDYWFVQFDFPISASYAAAMGKPEWEGKPYKASGGKMVYNEQLKREIPEGWGNGVLSDIANIIMGQSPSGSSYNTTGEGTVFYQGSTDFGLRFPTVRKYTTEPSRMAEENDILLSVRAPVGTLNQAMESCCIGRGLAALREKEGSISFLWSQMEYFKQIFDRKNASGTTFGSITKDDLFNLKVCVPEKQVLESFKKIADPFHDRIIVNSKENQELASLRDWLLPMLMNGQATVGSPAEKRDEKLNSKSKKKVEVYGEVQGELSPDKYREVAEEGAIYKESKN